MVDNHTVSSAERFAAILQDARAATIAGVRSYGAGCGFTNGGIPTQINAIGADVHLPDCIQLRAYGTKAVAGITPDMAQHVQIDGPDSSFRTTATTQTLPAR